MNNLRAKICVPKWDLAFHRLLKLSSMSVLKKNSRCAVWMIWKICFILFFYCQFYWESRQRSKQKLIWWTWKMHLKHLNKVVPWINPAKMRKAALLQLSSFYFLSLRVHITATWSCLNRASCSSCLRILSFFACRLAESVCYDCWTCRKGSQVSFIFLVPRISTQNQNYLVRFREVSWFGLKWICDVS